MHHRLWRRGITPDDANCRATPTLTSDAPDFFRPPRTPKQKMRIDFEVSGFAAGPARHKKARANRPGLETDCESAA
jgi:hypothetical protein